MSEKIKYNSPVIAAVLLIIILLLIPTGFEGAAIYTGSDRCAARVIACDNSAIIDTGLVRQGEQVCRVKLLGGLFKGQETEAVNMLNGSLEQDKIFAVGDKAYVLVSYRDEDILTVTMVDHYRLNSELVLAAVFVVFLVAFAGKTGVRAVLSFIVTVLSIWKVLVPLYLKGFDPIITGGIIVLLLSVMIIALVYGFDRRTAAASLGVCAGIITTAVTGMIFTDIFKIHGAVMSFSESLLYNGYNDLNLTRIFMASIFIGSSGAVMDLAVDITSAVHEVIQKKPDISRIEAIKSGMNVGRAAMGTITTTLLLAYSGSCCALLMVFMAQGTPLGNILNYKYVAAEIVHTVVGSFGLVSVAPLTALACGVLLTGKNGE
ncbi:MAG: YibE/F family protein [Oscillospiraceae bacterium]|nr:YibE/F family protein [Oscillospiraceae bacterium]